MNLMAPALEHENAIAVDYTLGLASHSIAFPQRPRSRARLIGIDRDSEALGLATGPYGTGRARRSIHSGACRLRSARSGVGGPRTSNAWTPYSWIWDYPACRSTKPIVASPIRMMRRWICMDVSQPLTAERILATYDAVELVRIFKEYGEEAFLASDRPRHRGASR